MSLVIYKSNKLYADTKAWGGIGVASPGFKDKVLYADDGSMLGIATAELGMPYLVLKAYNEGLTQVPDGDFHGIVIKPDGTRYFWSDTAHIVGPLTGPFGAVGTGGKYALGALMHGATVKEAFEVASKLDPYTDSKYRTYSL